MNTNDRIRVLQLGSPTGLYGAERWILALVKHLDRTRVEPEVAVILDDPALGADLCKHAQRLGIRATVFTAYGRVNWSAIAQLRAYIDQHRIDVLHTHGYKTDVIGRLATWGSRCRIVTTPHGWSTNAGFKAGVYEMLDRSIFPTFDRVVPLSEDLYRGLHRIPLLRRKLRLIRNGVDIAEIDATSDGAAEAKAWKAGGDFVVGYIGQLIARKGLDTLLTAFKRLDEPRKRLVIVGDGESRTELEALAVRLGIDARVSFCGFRPDRVALLKGFDVFVLPSRLEGIPRCLMEAMAASVPVIASNIPGCVDLVEHGRTGLLFEVDRTDSLLACMRELRADAAMRARLVSDARRLIENSYSAEHMAQQYVDIYEELVRPPLAGSGAALPER